MKHIRLFEGFSIEDFYTPLKVDDYYEKVRESIPFVKKDIKYLASLLYSSYSYELVVYIPKLTVSKKIYNHGILVSKKDVSEGMLDKVKYIVSDRSSSKKGFQIHALNDDYFTISIGNQDGSNEHYLCDQMEGLLKVLKDKKII